MSSMRSLIVVATFLSILMSACGGSSGSSGSGYRYADDSPSEAEFDEDAAYDSTVRSKWGLLQIVSPVDVVIGQRRAVKHRLVIGVRRRG